MSEQTLIQIPDDVTHVTMSVVHYSTMRLSIQMLISAASLRGGSLNLQLDMSMVEFASALRQLSSKYSILKLPTVSLHQEVYQVFPK